jgi:hypothetical protein
MKYGVKNFNDGLIEERHKYASFEEARHTAISLSDWNIECSIVDLETGDELKHFTPYCELFQKRG